MMERHDRVPFATPKAFDRSLTDRIALTSTEVSYGVPQLRRQFAYGRLLARVFHHAPEDWVLKGATSLLARMPGQARHSMDVDLYFSGGLERAINSLHEAADVDLGDFFTFDITPGGALSGATTGRVLRVTAYLGDKVFEVFRTDVVITHTMTTEPDLSPPLELVSVPGLRSVPYRTYPISDQIADKYSAMITTFSGRPSTRYRDLVDLALIVTTQCVDADLMRLALSSEQRRRGIDPGGTLELPSADWRDGFEKIVSEAPGVPQLDADAAIVLVRRFVDPILDGSASGLWDPQELLWVD